MLAAAPGEELERETARPSGFGGRLGTGRLRHEHELVAVTQRY